mmetsp:Transcript_26922/g.86370  ORF Transcript_26922/g.86370 Transcript_26922/m.86370 type:complete len:215 (-) Transcript_26922:890-1534(-)
MRKARRTPHSHGAGEARRGAPRAVACRKHKPLEEPSEALGVAARACERAQTAKQPVNRKVRGRRGGPPVWVDGWVVGGCTRAVEQCERAGHAVQLMQGRRARSEDVSGVVAAVVADREQVRHRIRAQVTEDGGGILGGDKEGDECERRLRDECQRRVRVPCEEVPFEEDVGRVPLADAAERVGKNDVQVHRADGGDAELRGDRSAEQPTAAEEP